jgi:integrase/recombinase XerD
MDATDVGRLRVEFLKYCQISKSLSNNTIAAYAQDLGDFTKFCALNRQGSSPDPNMILAFVTYLQEQRGLKPASVRRRIACLRSFFKWLEQSRQILSSPFRNLDLRLKTPRRLPRALSRSQLSAVTEAASNGLLYKGKKRVDPRRPKDLTNIQVTTQLAIRLLVATGIRVGELTSIKLSDITPENPAIRIIGKGNRERIVFIGNQQLRSDLEQYVNGRLRSAKGCDRLLLNQRGKPLTSQSLRLRLRRISEHLEMSPRVTPHCFRHTAATLLLEEGLDIRFVQKLLGHSSISTTEIYTHVSDASLRSAVERADPIGKLGL